MPDPDPMPSVTVDGEAVPGWLFAREFARLFQRRRAAGRLPTDPEAMRALMDDALLNAVELLLLTRHAQTTLPPLPRHQSRKRRDAWLRHHGGRDAAARTLHLGEEGDLDAVIDADIAYDRLCEAEAARVAPPTAEEVHAHFDAEAAAGRMRIPEAVYALCVFRDRNGDPIDDQAELLQARQAFASGTVPEGLVMTCSRPAPREYPQPIRFEQGTVEPGFEELHAAAHAVEIGACSDILQSDLGLHLLIPVRKAPALDIPFEQAESTIREALHAQKVEQALGELADRLRAGATITGLPGEEPEPPATTPDTGGQG